MLPVVGADFINRGAAPPKGRRHNLRKHRKAPTGRASTQAVPPAFERGPACNGSHDAIDQELLGIWLSISRLRQMIWGALAPRGRVIRLRQQAPLKKTAAKKPRHKAA